MVRYSLSQRRTSRSVTNVKLIFQFPPDPARIPVEPAEKLTFVKIRSFNSLTSVNFPSPAEAEHTSHIYLLLFRPVSDLDPSLRLLPRKAPSVGLIWSKFKVLVWLSTASMRLEGRILCFSWTVV